jgi:general stress protein YciG
VRAQNHEDDPRDPHDPEDTPETPPDEPQPTPVQDPPAEPTQVPYVVGGPSRHFPESRPMNDVEAGANVPSSRKERRGFASMSPEKQREIASKGGRAAHQKGTAHEWTSEEARSAGRKGGQISRGGRGRLMDGEQPQQVSPNGDSTIGSEFDSNR